MRESRALKSVDERLASRIAAALIFVAAFFVFWLSPVYEGGDSKYSMLVSESLLQHGTVRLDAYRIPRLLPKYGEDHIQNGDMYQLDIVGDHLYHFFPPGSPVLSAPYVALMNASGVSAANPDQTFNEKGEETIQRSLAALLMALLAVIFFKTSRMLLPVGWSAVVALGGAFGTQIWSTASRAVWSQTWEALLLGIVLWMLLAQELDRRRLNPVLLASLLAWLYFVRPPSSVFILAISCYVFIFYRRAIIPYALTGALWFAGFVAYSRHNYGQMLPHYYIASRLRFEVFWTALAGNLISPSRGFFVFVPTLFFVFYLLARYRCEQAFRSLVRLALIAMLCHLIVTACFAHWWGGSSYGARMTMDSVPWIVLLAILGIDAMLRWRAANEARLSFLNRRAPLVAGALLLSFSVFVNARGALAYETARWNSMPRSYDQWQRLLWDWRHPQFLAGWFKRPLLQDYQNVPPRIDFTSATADAYLWYGWSGAEDEFRWNDTREAALVFALNDVTDVVLQIRMAPFLAPGKVERQRVNVMLNDQRVAALELREPVENTYSIRLPGGVLRRQNQLVFELPDASAPRDLGVGDDPRFLAIRVAWINFQTPDSAQ